MRIFLSLFISLVWLNADAQMRYFGDLGLNLSLLALSQDSGLNEANIPLEYNIYPRIDASIGLGVEKEINKQWKWRSKIRYSREGFVYRTETQELNFRNEYLSVNPSVALNIVEQMDFGLGIQGAYLVNDNLKVGNGNWASNDLNNFKRLDLGFTLSGSYRWNRILLQCTFYNGWNNTARHFEYLEESLDFETKHKSRIFTFSFAYFLN